MFETNGGLVLEPAAVEFQPRDGAFLGIEIGRVKGEKGTDEGLDKEGDRV